MQNTSVEYREQINKVVRNPSKIRVQFDLFDPQSEESAIIGSTNNSPYSSTTQLKLGTPVVSRYDTLEHNSFVLDSTKHQLSNGTYPIYQGYVSNSFSDSNCVLSVPPKLEITYGVGEYYQFYGFTIRFDELNGEYCSDITLKVYDDGVVVKSITANPVGTSYVFMEVLPEHNKIEIEFNKTSLPNRRVKVSGIAMGIVEVYDDAMIESAEYKQTCDPLSLTQPVTTFNFTFLDIENKYNPENPDSLYNFIEAGQRMKCEIGYELDNGETEWMLLVNNILTGKTQFSSTSVIPRMTINTENILESLNQVYEFSKWWWQGRSLYDLAVDILDLYGLQYELDASLNNYITFTPLPINTVRNLLQIIANAGMCKLIVDRSGKIIIHKEDSLVLYDVNDEIIFDSLDSPLETLHSGNYDLYFKNENMYKTPTITKIPKLRNLIVNYSNYSFGADIPVELCKIEITNTVFQTIFIQHGLAKEIALELENVTVTTQDKRANGTFVTCKVTGSGVGSIKVYGVPITITTLSKSIPFNALGEDLNTGNILLSNEQHATEYANWVANNVLRQNTFIVENRGYPELDCLDEVFVETLYNPNLLATVIENSLSYNGTITGVTKLLGHMMEV